MTFAKFREQVEAVGLAARRCSPVHWQICGGDTLVNVWPNTRHGFKFQLDGKESQRGRLEDAIRMAGPPEPTTKPADDRPPWAEAKLPRERVGLIRWLWRLLW